MAIVPDPNLIAQVQTIQLNLINIYRSLQQQSPVASNNMNSISTAYISIDTMLSSMVVNGTT